MNYFNKIKIAKKAKEELESESDDYINANYHDSALMLRKRILELHPTYYDKKTFNSNKPKLPKIFYFTTALSIIFYFIAFLETNNWFLPYHSPWFWIAFIIEIPRTIYIFRHRND